MSKQDNGARVALLVDGENVSSTHAGRLILASQQLGALTIKRVYGNATQINGWGTTPGLKVVHSGAGKNAADILLAVEAVQLFYQGQADTFVIASSDGDFSHVATLLREQGCTVIGAGEPKSPQNFRKSGTSWITLAGPPVDPAPLADLDQKIHECIASKPKGLLISQVNPTFQKMQITLSDLRETRWRDYFAARPQLYQISGTGQQTLIAMRKA